MMTSVTHQVTDDILADYAAGNLPEAFNLVVAAHVSLCDDARDRLDEAEALGGVILADSVGMEMSHGSLEATLKLIEGFELPADEPKTQMRDCDVLPEPVCAYVGGGLEAVKWRPLGMGAKQAILMADKDASVRLLHIPAGAALPDHGHEGTEMTLVLQGAFIDGADRFARGDIELADEDLEHTPVADIGEDCICLAATAGSLKFSKLLPKIAQPFLRI